MQQIQLKCFLSWENDELSIGLKKSNSYHILESELSDIMIRKDLLN